MEEVHPIHCIKLLKHEHGDATVEKGRRPFCAWAMHRHRYHRLGREITLVHSTALQQNWDICPGLGHLSMIHASPSSKPYCTQPFYTKKKKNRSCPHINLFGVCLAQRQMQCHCFVLSPGLNLIDYKSTSQPPLYI